MGKRTDRHRGRAGRDLGQAGQTVLAVDVHGTGTADTFTARSSESQRGVLLVLDLEQSVENHGAAAIQLRKRIELNSLRSITYFS